MTTGSKRKVYRDPYSPEEILVLVSDYEELVELRHKAWIHVRLMDVMQAFGALPPAEKEAVLICGFVGLPVRAAERLTHTPYPTIWRRYQRGLGYLADYLNGV